MDRFGGVPQTLSEKADALRAEGKTALYAAIDGRVAAVIAVADPIKETTPEAVKAIQELGITLGMMSGDSRSTPPAVRGPPRTQEIPRRRLPRAKTRHNETPHCRGAAT